LSKRLGSYGAEHLRQEGVEPMALLDVLARIGTSQPVEPIGSLGELADSFDFSTFGRAWELGLGAALALLGAVRKILAKNNISKPIWNTEVNYGLVGGPAAGAGVAPLSTDRQVGNVLRTFVLNAENGVSRVYWYSWDLLRMANTQMVLDDRITLTPAGQAMGTARSWLLGTRPAGCQAQHRGAPQAVKRPAFS
jgi:hypothetical protein